MKTSRLAPQPLSLSKVSSKSFRCFSQKQSTEQLERLFSNVNQATMKHQPGELNLQLYIIDACI